MKIIQTVNYIESIEHLELIFKLMNKVSGDGLRINMCKYSREVIPSKFIMIQNYLNTHDVNKEIIFDLPYPKNKSRIIDMKVKNGTICAGEKYIIVRDEMCYLEFKQCILLDCDLFQSNLDIIYYGDGEGAFKVIEQKKDSITVIALNNFYIIKGKAILCGYKDFVVGLVDRIFPNNFSNKNNISYLLSFVENEHEINEVKTLMGESTKLYPKIETQSALDNFQEINTVSDGILVARGDIAINTKLIDLYNNVAKITTDCVMKKKRLFFCTDILNHMGMRMIPERAELFDLLGMIEMGATDIVLPGSELYNFNVIEEALESNIKELKNKINFIKSCEK